MYIHISGWHTFCFGASNSLTVITWHRWHSGPPWSRSWWRCTHAFARPASLWILCCAILARKAAVRVIFPNHCRVSFHGSLPLVMPGKHSTPLLLFSNFAVWILDQFLRFLNCGTRKPFFCHFGHFQGKTHVQCQQRVWVTRQRSGFCPVVRFGSVPDPAKNPSLFVLAGLLP